MNCGAMSNGRACFSAERGFANPMWRSSTLAKYLFPIHTWIAILGGVILPLVFVVGILLTL